MSVLEERQGVSLVRRMQPDDVVCPAGQLVGEASVLCRIEGAPIDGRLSPESVETFCCGVHTACPSWQLEKHREAQGKKAASYLAERRAEGAHKRAVKEAHRQERIERARHMLFSDAPDAVAFRRRAGINKPKAVR